MTLIFDDIFSGRRVRSVESKNECLVQFHLADRMPDEREAGVPRRGKAPGKVHCCGFGQRPASPNDRDRRWRTTAAEGGDGVDQVRCGMTSCQPSQIILPATHTITTRPIHAIQRKRSI